MKALVYEGPFRMRPREIPDPAPGPGDVVVKVRAVGICGSDIHGFSGESGRRSPGMVMGHEIAGEVFAFGRDAHDLEIGRHVAVQPIISCGKCAVCREGKTSICLNKKMIGVNMGLTGGLSEYVAVPRGNVFSIARDIPFPLACLAEPLTVGLSAVKKSLLREGESVFIAGAGVIGLSILLMARNRRPHNIFISDNNDRKLGFAAGFGGTPVNFAQDDPVKKVMAGTDGLGADIAYEAVGLSASVRTALAATRPGGRIIWVGNAQQTVEVDMQDVVVKAKNITGVYCYTNDDFAEGVRWLEKNISTAQTFVEKCVAFDAAGDFYMQLAKRQAEVLRAVVVF
jgi:L-iditol 2-dehydrogenase